MDFEQIKLEMGEDLIEALWEVMMYLLPRRG